MKIIGRIFLLLLVFGLLFVPVWFNSLDSGSQTPDYDPVSISSYVADFTVAADGALLATETITAEFPSTPARRGIFRYFDTQVRSDPNVRLSVQDVQVTMDGAPAPVEFSWESDRYYVARVGDPNVYVTPGPHVYEITYRVPGATFDPGVGAGPFATVTGTPPAQAQSTFYWNVIAPGWLMRIDNARVTINLPEAAAAVECSAGTAGGVGPCGIEGVGTPTVIATAGDVPPATGMTVRIPLTSVPPSAQTLPWPASLDPILGRNVAVVGFVLLLTIAGAVAGALWEWRTKEQQPGLPIMYAPPRGLGPVQCVYVTEEYVGKHALVASILRAADLGLVKLFAQGKTWTVQGIHYPQAWQQADPATLAVGTSLGIDQYGASIAADSSVASGKQLQSAQKALERATKDWASGNGLVVSASSEKLAKVVWFVCLILGGIGLLGFFTAKMWGLPFAAFVIAGLGLIGTGVGTRRSTTGRRLWSEAGGFRRMLSTPSSEQRFDFAARQDTFVTYLPYAVAFGVADAWAEKYRTEMHTEPPMPMWYPTGVAYAGAHGLFGGGAGPFSSFESALSSSIGAYESSQRSSSSGGGGGGGFGGGGGGGGGGSW
ncbi:MAG: DUF2207 domain-containing protein [Actinobacteria bacterium]|nr:DUF2207 domain-containing protein [Actinomycetota bacterium]